MDGIHLLGGWYGCSAEMPEMTQAEALRTLCLRAAAASGMSIVGDSFHQFAPAGVTGTVLLAESHLAVHTWPERGYAAFDIFMCGGAEPRRALAVLEKAFNPGRIVIGEHKRGVL